MLSQSALLVAKVIEMTEEVGHKQKNFLPENRKFLKTFRFKTFHQINHKT